MFLKLFLHVYLQINRKEISSGKNWQPTENSRVCSQHFVDGQPTPEHPDPSLDLGKLCKLSSDVYHKCYFSR
jgi:hypothetical protein